LKSRRRSLSAILLPLLKSGKVGGDVPDRLRDHLSSEIGRKFIEVSVEVLIHSLVFLCRMDKMLHIVDLELAPFNGADIRPFSQNYTVKVSFGLPVEGKSCVHMAIVTLNLLTGCL
jgi:hypothetical protein